MEKLYPILPFEDWGTCSSENTMVDISRQKRKCHYERLKNKNFGLDYNKLVIKSGKYGFPLIKPYKEDIPNQFISLGDISRVDNYKYCVTGFEYDYILERLWYNINVYVSLLSNFQCVCNPDYSMYVDSSIATQISNKLRSHEISYILQENNIPILPSITWSNTRSYEFCFEGFSKGGVVIVSSIGTQNNECSQLYFKNGFIEMLKRLSPEVVILYGDRNERMEQWLPRELDIRYVSHYRFERARNYGK